MVLELNPETMSDEDLVVLTLKDQEAFLYIIQRYKTKILSYIRRLTNVGFEDAEDLLQDVFLKAYLNLNDFDKDLKFSSWLYAIARNQVISNHRKLQARAEGHQAELSPELIERLASDFDLEKKLDANYLRNNIFKILDKLDVKYRDVLVLKFLEEKNYEEISDIIKKPTGTVGSMINKAKLEFKKELHKQNLKF